MGPVPAGLYSVDSDDRGRHRGWSGLRCVSSFGSAACNLIALSCRSRLVERLPDTAPARRPVHDESRPDLRVLRPNDAANETAPSSVLSDIYLAPLETPGNIARPFLENHYSPHSSRQ